MDDILNNRDSEYKYGFTTEIEMEEFPKGLSEDVVETDLRPQGGARMVARFPAQGFSACGKA